MPGIAELSNPGVKYRLNQATGFLAALVGQLLAAKVPGAGGCRGVAPASTAALSPVSIGPTTL